MTSPHQTSRRTVLAAAVAVAAAGAVSPASAAPQRSAPKPSVQDRLVDNRFWTSYGDWRGGTAQGTR
ncbi:peptidase C39 family protein, partial [Streptomyces mesophilus]